MDLDHDHWYQQYWQYCIRQSWHELILIYTVDCMYLTYLQYRLCLLFTVSTLKHLLYLTRESKKFRSTDDMTKKLTRRKTRSWSRILYFEFVSFLSLNLLLCRRDFGGLRMATVGLRCWTAAERLQDWWGCARGDRRTVLADLEPILDSETRIRIEKGLPSCSSHCTMIQHPKEIIGNLVIIIIIMRNLISPTFLRNGVCSLPSPLPVGPSLVHADLHLDGNVTQLWLWPSQRGIAVTVKTIWFPGWA